MPITRANTTVLRKNSTGSDFARRRVNLIEGGNITITVADDSAGNEIDVTIAAAGGSGSPGGTGTEIQYRGGASTFSAVANSAVGTAGNLTLGTGAVTTDTPILNLTQTWNAGAVAFTGLKANVTDTASAAGSLLLDLQVGGVSKYSVGKTGVLNLADGVRQTFKPSTTNAGLNVGSVAGDPSAPTNGDLWYDSMANELTARVNGSNVPLGMGAYDPITSVSLQDDFIGGNAASGTTGEIGWIQSGGSSVNVAPTQGRPGVIQKTTSSAAGNSSFMYLRNNSGDVPFDTGDNFDSTYIFSATNADTDTSVHVGWMKLIASGLPTDGIYLEKLGADTNWFYVTNDGTSQTRTDSGVAVSAGAWVRLRIRKWLNGATPTVSFSINGGAETNHTTNVWDGPATPATHIYNNAAAAVKAMLVDYIGFTVTGLAR